MNRSYEIMYILRPDLEDAEIDKSIETFTGYINTGGGSVKNSAADQKMGRRRLAYTVNKFNDGFYVLLVVDAPANLIAEIERRLRVTEQVIKFLTVRTDEEEKRVAKIKAHRAAHVKRSALPQEGSDANESSAASSSAPNSGANGASSNTASSGTVSSSAGTSGASPAAEPQTEVTAVPAAAEPGEAQPAAQG